MGGPGHSPPQAADGPGRAHVSAEPASPRTEPWSRGGSQRQWGEGGGGGAPAPGLRHLGRVARGRLNCRGLEETRPEAQV